MSNRLRVLACASMLVAALLAPSGAEAAAAKKPDLKVSRIVAQPTVTLGTKVSFTVTVKNNGAAVANASSVKVYWSTDAKKSALDRQFGVAPVVKIRPGRTASALVVSTSLKNVPANTSWFAIACADDPRKIAETSETNNCTASAKVAIKAAPTPPAPTPPAPTPPAPAPTLHPITVTASQVGVEGSTAATSTSRVVRFTVSVAAGAGGTIYWRTASGTAIEGTDFSSETGMGSLTPTTSRTIDVRIKGDTLNESNETIILEIYKTTGELQAAPISATGEIADDDLPKFVGVSAPTRTSLVLTYDSPIAASSVAASGSQFTITPSLAVSAASVNGSTITLTTAQQLGGQWYQLDGAAGVTDIWGGATGAIVDEDFAGNGPLAVLIVNEFNTRLSDSKLELYVQEAGSIAGMSVRVGSPGGAGYQFGDPLPAIEVAAGDLIVLHSNLIGGTTETTSKSQCALAGCYASAWDVARQGQGHSIAAADGRVIYVEDGDEFWWDAVSVFWPTVTNKPAWLDAIDTIQLEDLWLPFECTTWPCSYAEAQAISVDISGMSTTDSGMSVQRDDNEDTDTKDDWVTAASSWGLPNA